MSIESNLPFEEYLKRPGITATLLKAVAKESLRSVKFLLDGNSKESDELDFGRAFHALLLEGKDEFVEQPRTYISTTVKKGENPVKPWNANSKTCRAWMSEQKLPILTSNEVEDLHFMVQAVKDCAEIKSFLKGRSELSIFTDVKERKLKIRIDLLPDDLNGPVIDFKKTRSADPVKFVRQIFDLKYYIQAALYLDVLRIAGIERKEFWFVAVEDKAPYNVFIAKMPNGPIGFIELGRKEYREAYHKLMNAINTNNWPSYGIADAEQYLSPWMMQSLESAT